jgi:autotransporter passenger strand-loop-strand repeat protein
MSVTTLTSSSSNLTIPGGETFVVASGVTLSASNDDGGTVATALGGTTNNLTVNYQGEEIVGGTDNDALVLYDSNQYVLAGGVANSTTMGGGSIQYVLDGGQAYDTQLFTPDNIIDDYLQTQSISAGGTAYDTFLHAPNAYVYDSGSLVSATLTEGQLNVLADGSTSGTQIGSVPRVWAGAEYVQSGGTAAGSTITSGGSQGVYNGGTDTNTVVFTGGTDYVAGTSYNAIINSGGNEIVYSDGLASAATVNSSGVLTIDLGSTGKDIILNSGTASAVSGATWEGGTLESAGHLYIQSGATAEGTISIDSGGIVSIPLANIATFGSALGAELLLTGTSLSLSQPTEITLAPAGILTVGPTTITFASGGNSVLLETPLASGIEITQGALCFSAGTRIQTPGGEVAVEELEVGDRVSLHDGGHASIKFIGTRSYDGKFIAGRHLALPVTFHKNSIAENIPARDLIVSPGHGMFIDGVIVPAWRLVNGRSVTQAAAVERVDYLHIELANGHGILLAENCPAESYFDIGTRNQFQNAAEFYSRYPGDITAPASCRPRIESGFLLEAIQKRIAARAGIAAPGRRNGGLRGFVDNAREDIGGGERVVSGWAQDPTQPEVPVILYVAVDDQPVMRILANQYRADLRAAGLGSGCHGFEITLPPEVKGRVDVRQAGSGAILPLTEAAAAMDGSLRPLRAGHAA